MRFVAPDLADPMRYPKETRRAVARRRDAVREAFAAHRERLRPMLPPPVRELLDADRFIHDGLIRSLRIDPARGTLDLSLLCGDLQEGYVDIDLAYHGIALTPIETSLLCYIAHDETAEIYWQEIDLLPDADPPVYIQRVRWNTYVPTGRDGTYLYTLAPEIELRFMGLSLTITPRADRDLTRGEGRITLVRDPDRIEGMTD